MGYNTDFTGEINIKPALTPDKVAQLNQFADKRQCTMDDHNSSGDKPSLWCNILIEDDGTVMRWNWNEKTYEFEKWIKYYIDNFLTEHTCNGEIEARGDDMEDMWRIVVENNVVSVETGFIQYGNKELVR